LFFGALPACWHKRNEKQNRWQCKALQAFFSFMSLQWKSAASGGNLLINLSEANEGF
jgi:hypothetical protein